MLSNNHKKPTLVDSFVMARKPTVSKAMSPVAKPVTATKQPVRNIDGIVRNTSHAHKPYRPPAGPMYDHLFVKPVQKEGFGYVPPDAHPDLVVTTPAKASSKRRERSKLAVFGIVGAVLLGGLSLYSLGLGQLLLAFYAVIAIWKRFASQQTFILALAMFGGIIVASAIPVLKPIAENLAVYAFLLLCIGTISLTREVRSDMKEGPLKTSVTTSRR
jgi:hypothetical protein